MKTLPNLVIYQIKMILEKVVMGDSDKEASRELLETVEYIPLCFSTSAVDKKNDQLARDWFKNRVGKARKSRGDKARR